jgi:hypothetical protein
MTGEFIPLPTPCTLMVLESDLGELDGSITAGHVKVHVLDNASHAF